MSFFKKPAWAADDSKQEEEKDLSTFYRRSQYVYADIIAHTHDSEKASDEGGHEDEEGGKESDSRSPGSSQDGAVDGRTFSSPSSAKRRRLSGSIGSDSGQKPDDDDDDSGFIDIHALKKSTRVMDTFGVGAKTKPQEAGEKPRDDSTPSNFPTQSALPDAGASTVTNQTSVMIIDDDLPQPVRRPDIAAPSTPVPTVPKPRPIVGDDDDDDDEEDDESDEELAELARVARERARRGISSGTYGRHDCPSLSLGQDSLEAFSSTTRPEEPADDNLVVHILVESDIPETLPLLVARKLSQNLGDVRRTWCLRQKMDEDVARRIFLTWQDKRVFDVTTCKGLGISQDTPFPEAMADVELPDDGAVGIYVHMKAYTEDLFEQYKAKKQRRLLGDDDDDDYLGTAGQHAAGTEDAQMSSNQADTKQISIRAPGLEEVIVRVVPQTSIGVIVATLRHMRDVAEDKTVSLSFDGETLDQEASVGAYDIEDEDCIDAIIR